MIELWQWNKNLETGVDVIDNQHKELLAQVNKLNSEACNGNKVEVGVETINFIERYIIDHFNVEEELQREVDYPGYSCHKASHDEFIENIKKLISEFSSEFIPVDAYFNLSRLLNEWLVEHIGMEDKSFADYIKAGK